MTIRGFIENLPPFEPTYRFIGATDRVPRGKSVWINGKQLLGNIGDVVLFKLESVSINYMFDGYEWVQLDNCHVVIKKEEEYVEVPITEDMFMTMEELEKWKSMKVI